MSRRKRDPFPRPSKNYGGSFIFDIPPGPDAPPPHEMIEADGGLPDPKTELMFAVARFVEAVAPGAGKRDVVEALTREFVEKLARAAGASPGAAPAVESLEK